MSIILIFQLLENPVLASLHTFIRISKPQYLQSLNIHKISYFERKNILKLFLIDKRCKSPEDLLIFYFIIGTKQKQNRATNVVFSVFQII